MNLVCSGCAAVHSGSVRPSPAQTFAPKRKPGSCSQVGAEGSYTREFMPLRRAHSRYMENPYRPESDVAEWRKALVEMDTSIRQNRNFDIQRVCAGSRSPTGTSMSSGSDEPVARCHMS